MSQKVSRKSGLNEEKDKKQRDSPAKDVKKKMTTNLEKEKQDLEKTDKQEKQAEKSEKNTDKPEKQTEKKLAERQPEKNADKKEKATEKRDTQGEKSKEDSAKEEKNAKNVTQEEKEMPQQNGAEKVHNGVTQAVNGASTNDTNGMVSGESDDDDVMLVIDDEPDQDEIFPELTYDDTSDTEGFELPSTDSAPSRSFTRRSQVKVTRTPETPRPASEKQNDKEHDTDPKDSKLLKLKEDAPTSDRKLRSADSPRSHEAKKFQEVAKKQEKTTENVKEDLQLVQDKEDSKIEKDKSEEVKNQQAENTTVEAPVIKIIEVVEKAKEEKEIEKAVGEKNGEESVEVEVVAEVQADTDETIEEKEFPRKVDTNYSKSRVKVSPYRRSGRIADQTTSSMIANYTGNNTTMEMDITETSIISEMDEGRESSPLHDDSPYLRGLRSIQPRRSYKKLTQVSLTNITNRSTRSLGNIPNLEPRPTAPVVGRKRRPEAERDLPEQYIDQQQQQQAVVGKRMRLLDRISHPFRRNIPHTIPTLSPDIVGINTDLPLTAPVVSADTFDPETLKPSPLAPAFIPPTGPTEPVATPLSKHHQADKRCSIM